MLNINGINDYQEIKPNIYAVKNYTHPIPKNSFDKVTIENSNNNNKISFKEGIKLIGKGIVKQVKNTLEAIVKNPIKTVAVVGATTAALFALPLIGIPTAVGGAALAIGFAGLALGKGAVHTAQFVKYNKAGSYDKAREKLEQIGGDSLDLALSAPFVPKAIKQVKNFTKYGKIAVNTQALKNIASAKGLKGKVRVLKDANKEASRFMNYNQVTETELSKLEGITETEKAQIKKYIREYNVPKDKIPEVVLEQWSQQHGVHAKPTIQYRSMDKNIAGCANRYECNITLNDYGDDVVKINGNCDTERYRQVGKARKICENKFQVDYQDMQTGELFSETIDKNILDDMTNLSKQTNACSEEAQRILTTTHERTHIDQYARFYQNGERMRGLTPDAKRLYKEMASELSPMSSEEAQLYRDMFRYRPKRQTAVAYTINPMEVQARASEIELLQQPKFQILDKVFKQVKNMKEAAITKIDLLLTYLRGQSASN